MGRLGLPQPGGVLKFSFPRSDLTVIAHGVTINPAFALGGWVAFKKMDNGKSMVMGDLVLTEDEVGPAMRALQAGGIEETALHNHLLGESPRILYMHISGMGDESALAAAIHSGLATTQTPLGAVMVRRASGPIELDTAGIARALGYTGKSNGIVYQVSIPRWERITVNGETIPPSMGVATAINFQALGGRKAAVTGDFVLRSAEVQRVIRALQLHGIQPTALHTHMLDEEPRLFFMHFWGSDDGVALAKGLRAALDQIAAKP